MGNRDDRLAARKLRNGLLDEVLVFGVDARGRLIEDDNGCVFENRPRDGDPLLFAARERAAAFADDGVKAIGKRHDEIVAPGLFGRIDHLVLRRVWLTK